MELHYKKIQNTIVVYPKGKVDVQQLDQIESEIKELLDKDTSSNFLLNLKDIEYVSSAGLGLFVSFMEILRQRGKEFGICNLNSPVKRIMEIVEMNVLMHIFADEDEAVRFLNNSQD